MLPRIERFFWFDNQIRQNNYPNAPKLARQFDICGRTAKRDIQALINNIGAPLEYNATRRGYRYSNDSYSLSWTRFSHQELMAILILRQLLTSASASPLSSELNALCAKMFSNLEQCGIDQQHLSTCFSANWNAYIPVNEELFQHLGEALLTRHKVYFNYNAPTQTSTTTRTVHPHHLQYYNGSWYLLGWCEERQAWRTFQISRISNLHICSATFKYQPPSTWQHKIQGACGIFQDVQHKSVKLLFSAKRAPFVREQHWCDGQQHLELNDGRLQLTIPVADYREIIMKILQHGSEVEVLEPADLRQQVIAEIDKMTQKYTNYDNY
ncbi:MAG: WYL domain-containing protein [Thermodesulfobacteriota bacterium]|nr:WYL domain-containing protein [Thermodesulfobacteriota bacterium]